MTRALDGPPPSAADASHGTEETTGEVTAALERFTAGDEAAIDDLLPKVYGEMRKLAGNYLRRERPDHTLSPTGLAHEAYLRLVGSELAGATLDNRVHFFAVAARAMRRILVENARRYQASRRASPKDRVELDDEAVWARTDPPPFEILAVNQALDHLRETSQRQADIVEMRYFGGLSESAIARILNVSRGTVAREWRAARQLLRHSLSAEDSQIGLREGRRHIS
jgi:RNA polymerase sigma factor (TIGR02999 family)